MSNERNCRCLWVDTTKADYVKYHDEEWGVPIFEDNKLFECLTLESAQAGLSWYTVLKKRDGYRKAFSNFTIQKVAQYTSVDEERLLIDSNIIRHKGKISATINNAKCFIEIQKEFRSFSHYLWSFANNTIHVSHLNRLTVPPASSSLSIELSKDLKKRGFKFVGPTIIYAYIQAVGLVNDHSNNCFRKLEIIKRYDSMNITWNQC